MLNVKCFEHYTWYCKLQFNVCSWVENSSQLATVGILPIQQKKKFDFEDILHIIYIW